MFKPLLLKKSRCFYWVSFQGATRVRLFKRIFAQPGFGRLVPSFDASLRRQVSGLSDDQRPLAESQKRNLARVFGQVSKWLVTWVIANCGLIPLQEDPGYRQLNSLATNTLSWRVALGSQPLQEMRKAFQLLIHILRRPPVGGLSTRTHRGLVHPKWREADFAHSFWLALLPGSGSAPRDLFGSG